MPDTLFTDQQQDQPQIDPNKDYFVELVGEGRKYKDPKALAYANAHGTAYIEILERKLDAQAQSEQKLREEYNAAASLRELMKEFSTQVKPQTVQSSELPSGSDTETPPALKPEDIQAIVARQIQETEVQRSQQKNFEAVQVKLREQLGENYAATLKNQTKSLGLTDEMVNNLARTAPEAFFKMVGLDEKSNDLFQAPLKSSTSFQPKTVERTWSWYENLKKSDPKAYKDPKTAVQMMQDRNALGEKFKDGNWNSFQRG